MNAFGRQTTARWGVAAALVLALGACDNLLEVDLPAAVTEDALNNPEVAPILVNSVMALVECGYSSFAIDAAGAEDGFQEVTGVAQDYSQYDANPSGGTCDGDAYSAEWIDPFLTARGQGYDVYEKISGWDVPDKQELLATTAIYTAVVLENMGTYFCEGAINEGPLLTPDQVLDTAMAWLDRADTHIGNAGDFAIDTDQGTVASSAQELVDGLRARMLWAQGQMASAATVAAGVSDDFMAYILREEGDKRRNMVASTQGNGGGVQAAGFVQGPVVLKTAANDYGISLFGNKPTSTSVNGGDPWGDGPQMHTGYRDLAIDSEGRAVDNSGQAITMSSTTDVVGALTEDSRVPTAIGNTAGGLDVVEAKYGPDLSTDIPLVNWREMRLIQAEAAGPGAAATALVNSIRTADGLPNISGGTGGYEGLVNSDADAFMHMIIEERRRALWLEARYWATKLQHTDMLWFPRNVGDEVNAGASYALGGLVRYLLPQDEYQINPNFRDNGGLDLRATGCPVDQAPVGSWNQ